MKKTQSRHIPFPAILALFSLLALSGFAGCASAASDGRPAASVMPQALAALEGDPVVRVELGRWAVFHPASGSPAIGLVFYPGGRVDWRSYAPAAREIARAGYLVVIAPMPFELAVFNPGAASAVVEAFPDIRRWAAGGHSLGGVMAASWARKHPDKAAGLLLWASYPAKTDDLSSAGLAVASISGDRDGLSTPEKIAASRALLPPSTRWTEIEGGNHAQFGWYGPQKGDGEATITRDAQQSAVVAASVEFLASLGAAAAQD